MGIKQGKYWILSSNKLLNVFLYSIIILSILNCTGNLIDKYQEYVSYSRYNLLDKYLDGTIIETDNNEYENRNIIEAKKDIIEYINSGNSDNKDYYISGIEDIMVIGFDISDYYDEKSVASYINSNIKDIIVFKRDYSYIKNENIFINIIRHELVHKLEAMGYFCEITDEITSSIYIQKIYSENIIPQIKDILIIKCDREDFENLSSFFGTFIVSDDINYLTNKSETLSRMVNMHIFLYKNGYIDDYDSIITHLDIKTAIIETILMENVESDYIQSILLLDLSIENKQNTLKNINYILKTENQLL